MPAPLAFLAESHATLLLELRQIANEIATRQAVDIRSIEFESLLAAMWLETPEAATRAMVESLAGQKALDERAIVILLAMRRTLGRHVSPAGASAIAFLEQVIETAAVSFTGKAAAETRRIAEHHEWVFDHMPAMMHSIDGEGKLASVNKRWLEATGYTREEVIGHRSTEFLTPESARYAREVVLPAYFKTGRCDNIHYQFVRKDGTLLDIMLSAISDVDLYGQRVSRAVLLDVTSWMASQRDAQTAAAQEEVIRIQREMLRAISTPLVPLGDGILLMPLVGNVDAMRAEQIMAVLLDGVVTHAAEIAILDVTGVPSMDAAVAEALIGATKAVGLLGAGVILTGIGPAAARTLVELGVDLTATTTKSTLRDGLATARKRVIRRA